MRATVCRAFGAPLVIEDLRLDPPREGEAASPDVESARGRLRQMSETGSPTAALVSSPDFTGNAAASSYQRPPGMVSAHERLAQLAGLDEPERPERGLILEPEE